MTKKNIMNNLFFVHTPLQMVIAQQLIHQEKLTKNVLLYGYIDDNSQFIDIFNLLKIENIWNKSIYFENLPACADLTHRRPVIGFWRIVRNIGRINEIIQQYNIDNIYLGDIDNIGYQFLMFYFKGKVKVNIYEEGSSHYKYKFHQAHRRRFQGIQKKILDYGFYIPFFGFKFAKYWFREGDYYNLPMDCRFSIIPGMNRESFDKLLTIDFGFLSSNLQQYINEELSLIEKTDNVNLLITSRIYEHQDCKRYKERYAAYLCAIDNYVSSLPEQSTILVKIHPRESEDVISDIKSIIEKRGNSFRQLSRAFNIPVEIYLQMLKPSRITLFWNSSSMYNGYLYPKCEICDLIEDFFKICKAKNVSVQDIKTLYEAYKQE